MVSQTNPSAANSPLLTTKLFVPLSRTEQISRPRLLQLLDEGLESRLILVSAPAGFGKTTLLSEWIRDFRLRIDDLPTGAAHQEGVVNPQPKIVNRFAWLSLDAADDDPARFLRYLVAALQKASSGIGETALDLFRALQPPPVEALLTVLLNDMAALPTPILLVLDDYHLIDNHTIHEALAYFVDHLPPTGHVVLSTRADPPLPLARWRSRGQLLEVRADDLRFTPEEAAHFLNQIMGLSLSPEDVATLEQRTEGWVAGLQMAALSLRGRPDAAAFVQSFGGSHRHVLDYLVEEVLDRQPEEVLSFVLQTSLLERLCGPLCDAVTGRSGGQTILEHLERANLFLVPLDEERRWYRYHHLFAELLRVRLHRSTAGPAPTALYVRAAEWCQQKGLIAEAISYALAGQDWERAADLIEWDGQNMLIRAESSTLLLWVRALPGEFVQNRPWIAVYLAWALLVCGQLDGLEELLARIEEQVQQMAAIPEHRGEFRDIQGNSAMVRAYVAMFRGDLPKCIHLAQLARGQVRETNLPLRGRIALLLGEAQLMLGCFAEAAPYLEEANLLCRAAGDIYGPTVAWRRRGQLLRLQGQLAAADRLFQENLDFLQEHGRSQDPVVGMVQLGLGYTAYERNDLPQAESLLRQAIARTQHLGQPYEEVYGRLGLAAVFQARGETAAATEEMVRAESLLQKYACPPVVRVAWATLRVRLWLAQGDLSAASSWVQERSLRAGDGLSYPREAEHITLARVLLAQGELRQATDLLARLGQAAAAAGRSGRLIEILVLQALALQGQKRTAETLAALGQALALGEPEGYARVFLDEGAPLAEILRLGASRRVWTEPRLAAYAQRLSAAFPAAAPTSTLQAPTSNLVEPLSERELEVLRLVAAGRSNQQIAEELILALGTVKTHVHNIYGKLGVETRVQAIARARELGLL